jgi:hypothetical protein
MADNGQRVTGIWIPDDALDAPILRAKSPAIADDELVVLVDVAGSPRLYEARAN